VVTHQVHVERKTGKIRRSQTDVLPRARQPTNQTYSLTDGALQHVFHSRSQTEIKMFLRGRFKMSAEQIDVFSSVGSRFQISTNF